MEEQRKALYRELLAWGMIDMRAHSATWASCSNLWKGRRSAATVQFTYAMNDFLHNVAFHSAYDFEEFDEKSFWSAYRTFRKSYPADRWAPHIEETIEALRS
ncbi:hypothetical protein [Hymenobacter arizonensis]|uniref:hypothetical protein n=1 Tax=Hymenobacter arizonensis TaxID=1227077 RepID=UPI000B862325|nr:hypothetical protein [Hymenobacter arizonensis]